MREVGESKQADDPGAGANLLGIVTWMNSDADQSQSNSDRRALRHV